MIDLSDHAARLQRLEESLGRLEHLHRETLHQLRHLVQLLPPRSATGAAAGDATAILRKAS